MQRLPAVGGAQKGEAAADFFFQPEQLGADVVALPGQFGQRHGIGQLRGPAAFIEIETDPDDAFAQGPLLEDVLDQDAADLAVADPDVVGPLDARLDAMAKQVIPEGEGGQLRDEQDFRRGDAAGPLIAVEDAEGEVLARGRIPGMDALSAPRRLGDRCHD